LERLLALFSFVIISVSVNTLDTSYEVISSS